MKREMEKFGWFAERAPAVPALPATDPQLDFLVKADDVSSLEPEPTAESYRECDRTSLEKLFGLEAAPEGRSSTSMAYEEMTTKVFGHSNPTIMDIRSNEPVAPPKYSVTSLEKKRDKNGIFNGAQVEFHGKNKWTHFFMNGELVRMRLESPDFPEAVEFDGDGNAA